MGIAHADDAFLGERHEGIGAFHPPQGVDEPVDDRAAAGRHQVDDDLGVRRRLEDAAAADQFVADADRIGQIAVMGDGEAAELEVREQRLHVPQVGLSGRGIARMTDRHAAFELLDDPFLAEDVADQAEFAVRVELTVAGGDDPGGFLAAVLQGMEAERRMGGRVEGAVNAEDRTFFVQVVVVEGIGGGHELLLAFEESIHITPGRRGVALLFGGRRLAALLPE